MDQADSILMRQEPNLNETIVAEILSISSNISICSDFCGFKEFQENNMSLKQENKYLKDLQEFDIDSSENNDKKTAGNINSNLGNPGKPGEIFEVNSNSTTDTIRRQRLERNKKLRLKETNLISRNPIKKLSKITTFQKKRAEENSESSSEFPATSPSNTQLPKTPQQSQRPPLLKNTLFTDAYELDLALLAVKKTPMTLFDKIGKWQCATVDQLSDVEDVINFDESFKSRLGSTKRLPMRSKKAVSAESYTTFAEFYKRIASMRAPKRNRDTKQKSKFTSEDDEKPTTSNCLARNRETPLKKRPTKYKRAADPINDANIPKKKTSSSGTPKQKTSNIKKKASQQKIAANAAGDDAENSETSSHAQSKKNSMRSSARCSRQLRPEQSGVVKSGEIIQKYRRQIGLTTSPKKDDQDAFFRWRRLSREIDKNSLEKLKPTFEATNLPVSKPNTGLIQIRYDFMGPNQANNDKESLTKSNAYNVVVKTLKVENPEDNENKDKFKESKLNSTTSLITQKEQETQSTMRGLINEKAEIIVKDLKSINDSNKNTKTIDDDLKGKSADVQMDYFSVEFHQQHEFCNYLGLTEMSTANAMANAAEELSKCNIARRSLRVRKKEVQKAKASKQNISSKKIEINLKNSLGKNERLDTSAALKEEFLISKTMENGSSTICAENIETKSLQQQANEKLNIKALTPSEHLMQQTKDREAKIQILCQITASSKKEEEEACKKCVEQITEPIRRNLLEQCKQGGDGPKISNSKAKLEKKGSKRLMAVLSSSSLPPPLVAESTSQPAVVEKTGHIIDEETKFIELTPKLSEIKKNDDCKAEMQTLHEKVQRCLDESRQNPPNIFIVKSLDSFKDLKDKVTDNNEQEMVQVVEKSEELLLEDMFDLEEEDDFDGNEMPLSNLRIKPTVRNNKATQVSTAEAVKDKKRKARASNIRKANAMTGTRRLYTRSMLNLNQQRELRNRKVILKLLKTYSGLRIKVSQPKKKTNSTKASNGVNNIATYNKKKRNVHGVNHAASIELAVSSEETTVGDKKSSPIKTLYLNKISESSSINAVQDSSSIGELVSTNEESMVDTTNDLSEKQSQSCETKAVFEYENLFADELEKMATTSSRTLTPKCILSAAIFEPFNAKEKLADAAVQTDLANVTTILQPLCLEDIAEPPVVPSQPLSKSGENDMDVVSSSDVVTSTTTHIGEQNRSASNHLTKTNLVTKELYRNFSFTAESNVTADAAPSQTSTATNLFTELNPLANVSLNSSAANINDLGIHALSEPSRALRNPLKTSDGPVLYMFYEEGLLIVVQELLISFWKYSRILNALTVKLHNAKLANSCNSRDVETEELQSSAATMGFRSSDLEHMSSMLVSGCEWFYLGERKRLTNDMEIESPYMNRLCYNDSRPVYVEMRCRELLNDFRECNLLSCYVNIYFFNEDEQVPCFHSIQLDTIQSAPTDVIYTTIFDSRYFVLAWPQANVLGKVRSGVCKYALTPELDMLATTRDFKAMRHALRSLECLKDGKLLGFGDSQLTVWDHRSGDVLMNYDLSMPLGRNLGTIYYQGLEDGQDNVVVMMQHVRTEASSDLVVIACTISSTNPSRRVLQRHRMPTPAFCNISRGVNNGEHFVITAVTDEEIWISCNDPRQLIFIPAQRSQRFYSTNRTTLVELTHQTLTVDSFSNYLLKIASGITSCKKKLSAKAASADEVNEKSSWVY